MFLALASLSLPTCPGLNIMTLSVPQPTIFLVFNKKEHLYTDSSPHQTTLVSNIGSIKAIVLFAVWRPISAR